MNGTLAHITPIRGVNDEGRGKKHALHLLIHATDAEVLWLHDNDIVRPAAGDREALAQLGEADLLILPLRMRTTQDSLLQRLQVIEYTALQRLTVRAAQRGRAILCSGANLIVRRQVWLDAEPHLHPEMPSGDDMYLLEYCKRTGRTIAVSEADSMTATVTAQPTLRALLRQRARWAGKAPYYTDPDIRRAGAAVVLAVLLQRFFCMGGTAAGCRLSVLRFGGTDQRTAAPEKVVKLSTLNTQPSTLNAQHSTLNPQPSTKK